MKRSRWTVLSLLTAAHALSAAAALAVVDPLAHHGAVEVEEDALHHPRRAEVGEHPPLTWP